MEVNKDLTDWEQFIKDQRILHHIYLDLCKCKSEDDIYRTIVKDGLQKLHFDRIGILLISIKENQMVGSWGTDEKGDIVNQCDFKSDLKNEKWAIDAINKKDSIAVNYDTELSNENTVIGRGWNSVSAFFDMDEPIGWIVCDNYFSQKPLPDWKREIIGELGRIVGQSVSRFRQKKHLQDLVDERTRELRLSQKSLIESEKMAALGSLVTGVSHEMNTPLGNALTAASYFTERTEEIRIKAADNSLTKKELENYLNENIRSGKLTMNSLKRAGKLVCDFKKLAVNKSIENRQVFYLHELFETIANTLKIEYTETLFTLNDKIDRNISLNSYLGDFIQIVSILMKNSIVHGFEKTGNGIIDIHSVIKNGEFIIHYSDNGVGIPDEELEHVLEPFYTTKRHKGDTGLGLSILYNVIQKLKGSVEIKKRNPGVTAIIKLDKKLIGYSTDTQRVPE